MQGYLASVACPSPGVPELDGSIHSTTVVLSAQSRHKAYLRGSSKVLEALAVGAPKSLEDLAVVPAKRRALLAMLPAIRQRHRFHLQASF